MKRISACAALFALLTAAGAGAAPVAIVNAGFEELYQGVDVLPTTFPTGPAPSGWSTFGAVGGQAFVGVLNPGGVFFANGEYEGDNVALLYFDDYQGGAEFGIEQTLAATLTLNTVYTLQVDVGNIASGASTVPPFSTFGDGGFYNLDGFPGYRIELLAGGTLLAADLNTLLPGEGQFETSTLQATIGAAHVAEGQALTIRLVSLNQIDVDDPVVTGIEVDFDNVRLDASAVPLPGTLLSLALPAIVTLAVSRRRGERPAA